MNYDAYWIKINNKRNYGVEIRHIRNVLDNPKLFGFTKKHIINLYDKYDEKYGFEGKARRELFVELFERGWIRLRRQVKNLNWHANVYKIDTKTINRIREWAKYMINNDYASPTDSIILFETFEAVGKYKQIKMTEVVNKIPKEYFFKDLI